MSELCAIIKCWYVVFVFSDWSIGSGCWVSGGVIPSDWISIGSFIA